VRTRTLSRAGSLLRRWKGQKPWFLVQVSLGCPLEGHEKIPDCNRISRRNLLATFYTLHHGTGMVNKHGKSSWCDWWRLYFGSSQCGEVITYVLSLIPIVGIVEAIFLINADWWFGMRLSLRDAGNVYSWPKPRWSSRCLARLGPMAAGQVAFSR
jgi:hypothetical protein